MSALPLASGAAYSRRITGDRSTSLTLLREKLGTRAYAVWAYLAAMRDRGADEHAFNAGEVHPQRATIAAACALTSEQAKRALDRLRRAGLLGRTTVRVGPLRGSRGVPVRASFYPVRGGVQPRQRGERAPLLAWVPEATVLWLNRPETRGGARAGTGRKTGARFQKCPDPAFKSAPPMGSVCISSGVSPNGETRGGPRTLNSSAVLRRPPPFPSDAAVQVAEVPAPPKLAANGSPLDDVRNLLHAYRAAIRHHYDRRAFNMTKRRSVTDLDGEVFASQRELTDEELASHKLYETLRACAARLREEGIAPAAWVAFAIRKWRFDEHRKKPPPIPAVFGPAVVAKHAAWFRAQNEVEGRATVYTPGHRALYLAWHRMSRELFADMSAEEVSAVVERHFPGDTWERMMRVARTEAQNTRRVLQDRVAAGEWVW
jgi:hypothetical protein